MRSMTFIGCSAALVVAILLSSRGEAATMYKDVVAGQNPIAYYHLNEVSAASALDSIGGHNATYDSAVTLAQVGPRSPGFRGFEPMNLSPQFDMTSFSSGVILPTSLNMSDTSGSVSLWFAVTHAQIDRNGFFFYGSSATSLMGDGFGSGDELHVHINSDGTLGMYINESVAATSTSPAQGDYADGDWHHLVFTWNMGDAARLYADGQQVLSAAHTSNPFNFSRAILIGRPYRYSLPDFPNGIHRVFGGELDEVAVFNRALTDTEVREQYSAAVPEPISFVLLGTGTFGLLGCIWRQRRVRREMLVIVSLPSVAADR